MPVVAMSRCADTLTSVKQATQSRPTLAVFLLLVCITELCFDLSTGWVERYRRPTMTTTGPCYSRANAVTLGLCNVTSGVVEKSPAHTALRDS